ncbi:MAG: hypothetical protein ACRDPA_33075, partial [Solirubrobacteraceae bacterium]
PYTTSPAVTASVTDLSGPVSRLATNALDPDEITRDLPREWMEGGTESAAEEAAGPRPLGGRQTLRQNCQWPMTAATRNSPLVAT